MNKIVTFIIILIGFVQVSFAQIQFKDSTEAYNYWAKRGVIEVVYAYMEDYESVKGTLNTKEALGKNNFIQNFISTIGNDNISAINEKFNSVSSFLVDSKYDWKGCEKTLFQPLKRQVTNSNQLESIFSLKRKDKNGKDIPIDFIGDKTGKNLNRSKNWNEKTTEIFQKFNKSLSTLRKEEQKTNEKPESVNIEEKIANTEQQPKVDSPRNPKKIPWKTILYYGGVFIVGILIGIVLIVLITKSRIKSIINEEDGRKYDDYSHAANNSPYFFSYLRAVYFLNKQKDKYKKESELANQNNGSRISELERKLTQLEKEKRDLLDENIDLGKKLDQEMIQKNEEKTENQNLNTNNFISQHPVKKIYFSMPGSDGSFQISNGEISNDGKKYFKIEFEESSTTGELFYLSGDRDQRAINRLESYLKPVCDIENITYSSTASKIELTRSGKVSRLNDSWVIDPDNKIKIKLY